MSECSDPAAIIECDLISSLHAMLHSVDTLKYWILDPGSLENNYRRLLCFSIHTRELF
jgi:hypothetical protein